MATATEADIFSRIFQPEKPNLSRDAARSILALDFDEKVRARMNYLSETARQGKLSRREDAELEQYIQVGNLFAIMQSKARRSLRNGRAES